MIVTTEQSVDFLNSFLQMGGFRVIKEKVFDHQSGYTYHQSKLCKKSPNQSYLNKIRGEDWTEIGKMETSIVDDKESFTLFLKYRYRFAHEEISELTNRAVRIAVLLGKIPKNTQVHVVILPRFEK